MADWHFEYEGLDVTDLVLGFCEAMLFSDNSGYDSSDFFGDEEQEAVSEGRADGCIPSDAAILHIDTDGIDSITTFCGKFARDNAELLAEALERTDAEAIGRDLYYVRAGHGVGFDDREELKASEEDDAAYEELTEAMGKAYGVDTPAWEAALAKRNAIEARGIAARLTVATGRGEVSTDAYEEADAYDGFRVSVYLA